MAVVTDHPPRSQAIVDPATGVSSELMFVWMALLSNLLREGFTGTITTAALTGGGVQGSMTFQNGVLIDQVAAT